MNYKKYIYSLFPYILFSSFIFLFSIINGYFFVGHSYDIEELISNYFRDTLHFIINSTSIEQFFFIFVSNTITLFLTIFLGFIFAIFPFLVLFANGSVIGILMLYFNQINSLNIFFIGIIPHGIIEIPILIIGSAIGLKMGKVSFDRIFRNNGDIKKEFSLSFIFFSRVLFPLLFLAAFIEIFFTKRILELF